MLALSRSYVHMEYESITPDEIDALAEYAYEIAETAASEFPEVRPVGVAVRVEEGSIDIIVKKWGQIFILDFDAVRQTYTYKRIIIRWMRNPRDCKSV